MNENQRKICTEIWQEYESQLRKICKIKLQSHPNEIDDVMSEVSLALCKQIKKYGEPNKPKQWLYATLNNIINLKYRELYKFKEKQESLENNDFELPFEENGIESKIEEIYNNEIRDKLSTFLSNDEYIIIKYIYFDRLKMKEIADENGDIRIFAGGKTVINAFEKDIPKANITRVPAVLVQSRMKCGLIHMKTL